MLPKIDIIVVEQDGNVFDLIVKIGDLQCEVVTELDLENDLLIARGLHMDGPGPGLISPASIRAAARKLALSWGARAVRIEGGVRTTGAAPGRRPRPLVIHAVEDVQLP
jgi:hypothetical protein